MQVQVVAGGASRARERLSMEDCELASEFVTMEVGDRRDEEDRTPQALR